MIQIQAYAPAFSLILNRRVLITLLTKIKKHAITSFELCKAFKKHFFL
jgi:hypothetical protein